MDIITIKKLFIFYWSIMNEICMCADLKEWVIFLQDALSLHSRPPFHNTTVVLLGFLILLGLQKLGSSSSNPILSYNVPWIFLVAWLSHHVRDAHRRGLWFWPLGSTRPLPRWLYIGTTITLPLIVRTIVIGMPSEATPELSVNGETHQL